MRVPDFDTMPRGYGLALRNPAQRESICYLVPFNWIVRWSVAAWWKLAVSQSISRREQALAEAKHAGYESGYTTGYVSGQRVGYKLGWDAFAKTAIDILEEES